tara:strand:+ start:298 stop:504 length:207 start_codon:yes stop_codon:yes gene_type:complete
VNNGIKLFLQLKSMAKNLSKTGFKVKIEQSYEDVVMRQVGPNWYSESSPMDLVKDFQKIVYQHQNSKI